MRGHSHRRRGARPGRLLRRARRATGAAWTGLVRLDADALRAAGLEPMPVGRDAWVPALVALGEDALLISTTRAGSQWPGLRIPVEAVTELTTGSPLSDRGGLTLHLGDTWVHLPLVAGDGDLDRVVHRLPRWAARLPRTTGRVAAADLLHRHAARHPGRSRSAERAARAAGAGRHAAPLGPAARRRRLVHAAAAILAGALLLAAWAISGPLLRASADELRTTGVRTVGTVTVLYPDSPQVRGRIEVTYPADAPRYRSTVDLGAGVDRFRAGEDVTTWYDPADPQRIAVDGVGARPAWSVLLGALVGIAGVAALASGLGTGALALAHRRRDRRAPRPTIGATESRTDVEVQV